MLTGTDSNGMFAIFDCKSGRFSCSSALTEVFGIKTSLWEVMDGLERRRMEKRLTELGRLERTEVCSESFKLRDSEGAAVPCRLDFVCSEPGERIVILVSRETTGRHADSAFICRLPGLLEWNAFLERLDATLTSRDVEGAVVYFDIQRFKVINDMFGMAEGDRLLRHIAAAVTKAVDDTGFACRLNADRFVYFSRGDREKTTALLNSLFDEIATFSLPFEIMCNAGVYIIEADMEVAANVAVDSAIMAQNAVKGSYTHRYNFFTETLRQNLLGEQFIAGIMSNALKSGQFVVYYQPQYNHSTKMLIGAEALVRWQHPEKGIISPMRFVPVFENNGFISQLDMYVFENVCAFQRRLLDEGAAIVPISVNLSRYDLFDPSFLDRLDAIRRSYELPVKYVCLEITESSAVGGNHFINEAISKLHGFGYTVEMDDFGSGYSSLNILKDTDFDIVKLDMSFFEKETEGHSGRGGTILQNVVRMLNWLQIRVIAEGVETREQADFLRSIGCEHIQGYLYSKPVPAEDYKALLHGSHIGVAAPGMRLIESMDTEGFWSSESLETLIFSNYVGGAAIFEYRGGVAEVLRVNKKFILELNMNLVEKDFVNCDLLSFMDESEGETFKSTLKSAADSGDELECEVWLDVSSTCCGEEKLCVRFTMRAIGHSKGSFIFYAAIRNVTREKERWFDAQENERRFKAASEQVNIYYWEYSIATHEMRPCFRCMRDLGMPAVLKNYPDSAIEMGVFPPEVADMYRDWHRQLAEGAPSLEAVIPLTVGRVPFHVRYTTEFDECGRPVKAYGSAALVVDK